MTAAATRVVEVARAEVRARVAAARVETKAKETEATRVVTVVGMMQVAVEMVPERVAVVSAVAVRVRAAVAREEEAVVATAAVAKVAVAKVVLGCADGAGGDYEAYGSEAYGSEAYEGGAGGAGDAGGGYEAYEDGGYEAYEDGEDGGCAACGYAACGCAERGCASLVQAQAQRVSESATVAAVVVPQAQSWRGVQGAGGSCTSDRTGLLGLPSAVAHALPPTPRRTCTERSDRRDSSDVTTLFQAKSFKPHQRR